MTGILCHENVYFKPKRPMFQGRTKAPERRMGGTFSFGPPLELVPNQPVLSRDFFSYYFLI